MKIAYLGNKRFPWCTEVHLAKTLEQDLGHEVVFLQEDAVNHGGVLSVASQCDMFMWTRTWGLQGIENVLSELKNIGVPSVSYHLDLYWNIQRQKGLHEDPFWRTEHVFSPDGGSQQKFVDIGINHHFLWPGVFRQECVDGTPRVMDSVDVGFVGSTNTYHHEWPYRQQLVRHLTATYGNKFKCWPQNGPAIRGQELNDLYASVPIFIGDTLCPGFDHPFYLSDRVFETIGRGGFIIHPRIKGLEDESLNGFVDGENIVLYDYNDFDGLNQKIEYYLANPSERERIRVAGQKHVIKHHTYTNRLSTMIDVIGL